MAFCTNCGCKLKEGAKFCSKCGHPTGINPVVNQLGTQDNSQNEEEQGGFFFFWF